MDATFDTRRKLRRLAFVGGAITLMGPVILAVGTVGGMLQSFLVIRDQTNPTPDDLAAGIRLSLAASVGAGVFVLLGASILAVALVKLNRFDKQAQDRESASGY